MQSKPITSTILRRSLTYILSVSMISITTRSTYVSCGLGAMVAVAIGEGGSLRRSDDVIAGSDTAHCSSAGPSGGLSSRSISPADGDGVIGLLVPSTEEQEEMEDTTLTGRRPSERSALEIEQPSVERVS